MPISHGCPDGWNIYFPQTIGQCALILIQAACVLSNLDGGGYKVLNIYYNYLLCIDVYFFE